MTEDLLPASLAFLQGLDQSTALDPATALAIDDASQAFSLSADALAALPQAWVLDVRRAALVAQADTQIPGARWCNPVHIGTATAAVRLLPRAGQTLVLYCVHGHAVSRSAVLALRAQGLDARFLQGGIAAWVAAGRPVAPRLGLDARADG